jgi:hypothetical protein
MFKVDSDLAIHINRGDGGTLSVSANNETYDFEDGDKIKFNIYDQKGYNKKPLFTKEVTVQGVIKTYDNDGQLTGTYKQLEYIEGHDGYIDTNRSLRFDVFPNIEIVAQFNKIANSALFGMNYTTSSNNWNIHYTKSSNTTSYIMNSQTASQNYDGKFHTYKLVRNTDTDKYEMYYDETKTGTATTLTAINKNLYIGAVNTESSDPSTYTGFTGKIKSVKIDNTEYLPVKNLSNSKVGLLNMSSGSFYSSADTDHEFTAPPGTYDTKHVNIPLDESTTDFVPEINKKKTYWYDITLNEDTTIIGYEDADGEHPGAKLFNVYPAKTSFDDEDE